MSRPTSAASVKTVATHLRSVFRKLEVSSRAGLAAEAARHPA